MSYTEAFPEPTYRLQDLLESAQGDEDLEELYEDVDQRVSRYWAIVAQFEHMEVVQKFRLEPADYRQQRERLDEARRSTHNSLISSLQILARTLRTAGVTPNWWDASDGLGKMNRAAIGQWALRVEFDRIITQAREEDKSHGKRRRVLAKS